MILPNMLRQRLQHVRHLSGSSAFLGGAPPGYQNIFMPQSEMPGPLPKGPMTPELRAKLAAKYWGFLR